MTVRIAVSLMALAALAGAPVPAMATAASGTQAVAQAAAPLEVPPAPGISESPPAATEDSTGAGSSAVPPPAPATPGANPVPDQPDAGQAGAGVDDIADPNAGDELSLGEIPTIETMELTPDIAKRALDSYLAAKEKFADTDLDQYEDLQDFVDKTEDGKSFEADVKAAGFANVSDWNLAISTLTLTYGSVIDDQTADLEQQIKEIEGDTELAQDMKDKMVKALKALISSANNKKVIEDLMADPAYSPKLKQLDTEEE